MRRIEFMKPNWILLLAVVGLFAGCASAPQTDTYTYRGGVSGGVDMTLDNLLESNEDRTYLIWLNAIRDREGAWDARHYLEVRYEGAPDAGYLDIGPGQTLILTVDGQNLRFSSVGSDATRYETDRSTFVETALYPTQADVIRRIGSARDVKVQIRGAKRSHYREFKPENILKFRTFVLQHMGGF